MSPPTSDPLRGSPAHRRPPPAAAAPAALVVPPTREAAPSSALAERLRGLDLGVGSQRAGDGSADSGLRLRRQLGLLRALGALAVPEVAPELDPFAHHGHSFPGTEEALGLERGGAFDLLEELADLGLLARQLRNQVNTCPRCGACQVNFRETCPACSSFRLTVQRLVHHFSCAYVAPESEFVRGVDMVCPKCERALHQLGRDFDRPGETYVCQDSGHVLDDPALEGQCLACGTLFPGHDARVVAIHSYRTTALTARAVELNRLTGLDVREMLHDAGLGVASRAFFLVELDREALRLASGGAAFTAATIDLLHAGAPYPLFRDASKGEQRAVAGAITGALRGLDLVCRWNAQRFALLLLGVDAVQAASIRLRVLNHVAELGLEAEDHEPLEPVWRSRSFLPGTAGRTGSDRDEALAFLDGEGGPA